MKKINLLTLVLLLTKVATAQFQIDLGATLVVSNSKENNFMILSTDSQGQPDTSFQSYKVSAAGVGVFTYPKFHLSEFKGHSISVGLPISLGLTSNSQTGTSAFLYDLNIAADLNGGRLNKKSDNMDKMIGYYAGLGFGITNTDVAWDGGTAGSMTANTKNIITVNENAGETVYDLMSGKSVGILIHAGISVPYKFDKDNSSNMGIRLFAKPALGKNQVTYFGGSVFISFGKYTETSSKKNKR